MPLPAILAQEVWSVAQGMISRRIADFARGETRYRILTPTEITRALRSEYLGRPGVTGQALRGLAVRARNAFMIGERMQADAGYRPPRGAAPIDPALRPGDEAYRYRVLVEFQGEDGTPDAAVVEIRTDAAQTHQQIADNIAELIDWDRYPRATRQAVIGAALMNQDAQVSVISVGRRA